MKTFNASDLAHKRTEIFNAAKAEGAILQRKNTNGVVLEEFILCGTNLVDRDLSDALNQWGEDITFRKKD
jgi:uncharacterized protein YjbI with pentapeptide repeats